MTGYLITMQRDPDKLYLDPFEIEAADAAAAVEIAGRHMWAWHDYIAAGGSVPNRFTVESAVALERPPLVARNARRGAPDVDNPIIITLGGGEIGRLTMAEHAQGVARQTMTLHVSLPDLRDRFDGIVLHDTPGACRHQALELLRWALG